MYPLFQKSQVIPVKYISGEIGLCLVKLNATPKKMLFAFNLTKKRGCF